MYIMALQQNDHTHTIYSCYMYKYALMILKKSLDGKFQHGQTVRNTLHYGEKEGVIFREHDYDWFAC